MTLAASGFLPIAINILLVILVAVSLLLCLVVLMQRPKQEGLGAAFGGGMTDQAFGARTTDVLQKGTVWIGTVFFVVALTLSVLVTAQNSGQNIEEEVSKLVEETAEEVITEAEETLVEEPATEEAAPEVTATEETPSIEEKVTE